MNSEQSGSYLQPWIDRARAVQRLVGLVDLERIANHDVAEFTPAGRNKNRDEEPLLP